MKTIRARLTCKGSDSKCQAPRSALPVFRIEATSGRGAAGGVAGSNPLGRPPTVPGRQQEFDIYRSNGAGGEQRPLTRPAPAGEGARRGPPSPPGEGKCGFGALGRATAFSLPLGERVAEGRGRVRGLCPPVAGIHRRLAEQGCLVVIPTLIGRACTWSGNEEIGKMTNLPHREYIYGMADEIGRHIIGYEVQKVLAAVDWFAQYQPTRPIGVMGYLEGGLLALYSAAADTRIDAACVSGYFQAREGLWQEPLYRNVWSLLEAFGDAELAGLIVPRALAVEARGVPAHHVPLPSPGMRLDIVAPGRPPNRRPRRLARSTTKKPGRVTRYCFRSGPRFSPTAFCCSRKACGPMSAAPWWCVSTGPRADRRTWSSPITCRPSATIANMLPISPTTNSSCTVPRIYTSGTRTSRSSKGWPIH